MGHRRFSLSRRAWLLGASAGAATSALPPRAAAGPAEPEPGLRMTLVYKGAPPDLCVCDQALRVLPDGSWAIFLMTGGDTEPRKENYIALCRSADQGVTWSKPEPVLRFADRACLLSEAYVHGTEITIHGVHHGGYFENWRNFTITSADNGAHWSEPVPFAPLPRRAFIRNRYLASWGEWMLPYQRYDAPGAPEASPLRDGAHQHARNGVLISADEGRSWIRSAECDPVAGWAENNVVELSNGRLAMLIRADGKGCLLRTESGDRGRTWGAVQSSDIPNPGSKFRLHRLQDGRIVLIHNPNGTPGLRNPLAVWISEDDMRTWPYRRVITAFPGQLQYPDGFIDEAAGMAHFAFDYNRHDLLYTGAPISSRISSSGI